MKLYEISNEMINLLNQVDPETGELPSELIEVTQNFKEKGQGVVAYCLNLNADIEKRKELIKKLQMLNKADENRINSLKDYLSFNMKKTGISKIEALDKSFTATLYQDRDSSIEIEDESQIPNEFFRVKTEVNKTAIRDLIAKGVHVKGARLVTKDRLVIK